VSEFNPSAIMEVLSRHDVSDVLIGGYAALLQGSGMSTIDFDIVPAPLTTQEQTGEPREEPADQKKPQCASSGWAGRGYLVRVAGAACTAFQEDVDGPAHREHPAEAEKQ
jgi:hypothetical protein